MAKINYSFVEFHTPVFSKGKNFGTKIHAGGQYGVKLWYDTDLRFMCMEYKGHTTHFHGFHSADMINEAPQAADTGKVTRKVAQATA